MKNLRGVVLGVHSGKKGLAQSMRKVVLISLAVVLVFSCFVGGASGQSSTGSIVGTVIDSQGLPVDGATVTLTNVGTNYGYTSSTASNGGYQFKSIDYGYYKVSVTKAGFKAGVVTNIKLDAATQYSVAPITLELGATTETITVEAGAELVQTGSAEVTGTVEKSQIDSLPILDRNPLGLLGLQAGVNQNSNINTVINGQRAASSNVTLDGINIQDNFIRENALDFSPNLPLLSQAQEFTITSQNGDVDKSGSSGVSIVTPKGTNNWHGEGFWYYRSNAIGRANDWFNDARGIAVPNLLQNQGGGSLGGPIIKDKLFIYGYYELLRLRAQTPNNTTILSPAIQAALTAANPTLPFTFQPVDQNGNPSGPLRTVDLLTVEQTNLTNRTGPNAPLPPPTTFTINPTMLALIQRLPRTSNNNNAGDGINLLGFSFNERDNNSRDNYGFRADYNLNAKNTFSGTWSYNRNFVDRPDIDTSFNKVPLVSNDDHVKFLSTAWRWNPNANITNEVRFGFNLTPAFFLTSQQFGSSIIDSLGFPFTGPDPNFQPQGRNVHTWSYQDNASWVHGNHFIKYGGQLQRVTIFETNSAGSLPDLQIGFSAANTSAYDPSDFATGSTLISTTDFNNASALLTTAAGILSNVAQTFNVTSQKSGYVPLAPSAHNLRQNNLALYLADNWRITRKLSFTYGVRWDYFSPVDERDGLTLLPVIPPGQTAAQTLLSNATVDFAGGPSKRGLYNSYYKGFAPNIGLAWDPFGDGKMAIRAGFSMNYVNDNFFTAAENAFSANPGLSTANTAAPNGLNGPTVSNAPTVPIPPFAIPTTFATNANNLGVPNNVGYAIDPNIKPPYVEQWNLTVQRQIGANTSVSLGYAGNHGVGLFRAIDLNQVIVSSNGFLADFNRARSNGFLSLAANGNFDPLFNGPGSQPLTIFPTLTVGGCTGGSNGFIDQIAFINNDIQNGFIGDLAHTYQEFGCSPIPGFFAPNDLILGGDFLKNASFSTYHSGVAEIRHRLSGGLYLQANYVFSKVLTDYGPSDPLGGDQTRFLPYLDNARPRLERERAPFDINHAFKGNFTYDLPVGKGHRLASSNRFASELLDGWQTGSIFTWQSGNPYSILSTQPTFNRSGTRSIRNTAVSTLSPGQIASDTGVFVQTNGTVYGISPSLISPNGTGAPAQNGLTCAPAVSGGFCNPQPGQVGNLSLDAFTGPVFFDWDLAAAKDFRVTERFRLTFRTEAFNVLNHPVFFVGDQNINSRQFGQVVETAAVPTGTISAARRIQLSLRLKF